MMYPFLTLDDGTEITCCRGGVPARFNDGAIPDFLMPIKDEVDKIKAMSAKTQRTLRLAKKAIERMGDRFWSEGNPLNAVV